ncbi:MAG: helix-turn-helix domain-containing protein [Geobacter sp.]|nr:helix-turn-helix domain-containing protein [Geobacter sp.]
MSDIFDSTNPALGERIRSVRLVNGLTQKEFSAALGIVQGYLSGIERGKKLPSTTLLLAICHKWGLHEEWLIHGTGKREELSVTPKHGPVPSGIAKTPLLKKIGATFPNEIKEDEIADYIYLSSICEGCYAIIAEGDFMAPTIRDGDLVIFKADIEIRNRSIMLLNNRWGEIILRRCRIKGGETYFSPENSIYTPFKPDGSTRIFGTVVSVWRNIKI